MTDSIQAAPLSGPLPAPPVDKVQAVANIVNMLHEVAEQATDDQDHGTLITILRELQKKPGVKTSEFWIALALNAAGGAMQFWPGHEAIGAILMVGGGGFYTLARTVVKVAEAKAIVK